MSTRSSSASSRRTGGTPMRSWPRSAGGPTRTPRRRRRTQAMRLNTLVLRNYGLYKGKQIVDLAPRTKWGRERPIILVGGRNGAGKTTILEAVQLCLYGRLALGSRVSDAEYNSHLRDRIHRSSGVIIPINYASVALEFDFAHAGRKSTYSVERSWSTRGASG